MPSDQEPPNDEGSYDQHGHPDDSNHVVQHNLANVIAMLARDVQHQEDGHCLKVRTQSFQWNGPSQTLHILHSVMTQFQ
jgi:hypothetical protein